jgi:hypothetical protein
VDHCLLGVFKNLIYVFVAIIILSFGVMIYIITNNKGLDGYDLNYEWQLNALSWYIDHNPTVYGLS